MEVSIQPKRGKDLPSKAKYKDAKTEYVRTPGKGIGLRKLAIQWGIPFSTLGAQSTKENWVSLREQYWGKVDKQAENHSIAVHGDKQAHINATIAESLVMCGDLVRKSLVTLNKPITDKNFHKFKAADLILRSVKSATESINNLDIRTKEIYGTGESKGTTPEDFAAALDALALSCDTESPYPRSEA